MMSFPPLFSYALVPGAEMFRYYSRTSCLVAALTVRERNVNAKHGSRLPRHRATSARGVPHVSAMEVGTPAPTPPGMSELPRQGAPGGRGRLRPH